MPKNIALLTDFGLSDSYVGMLKGVLLKINSNIRIIDITHNIKPFNVLQGAWILGSSYKYFPENTIFIVVIDPGVGTTRKKLLLKTEKYYFIAPDNGVLSCILDEKPEKVISLENESYWLEHTSITFHGRDIFAPVGAELSLNEENLVRLGREISPDELVRLDGLYPIKTDKGWTGLIVSIDQYGNIITNIPGGFLDGARKISIKYKEQLFNVAVQRNYDTDNDGLFVLNGSSNTVEVSIKCKSAEDYMEASIGESISLCLK